jgi:hydrogenase maturation protease
MNRTQVARIADAVLYEGYILYPYRPSVKNRQRWTFGGLFPESYCQAEPGSDASSNQTEFLVQGGPATRLEVDVRFLHLTARQVGEIVPSPAQGPECELPFRPVETLRVGDRLFHTWQEAQEREIVLPEVTLGELAGSPQTHHFLFPGGGQTELLYGPAGEIAGILVRQQHALAGDSELAAVEIAEGLYRVTVRVVNRTPLAEEDCRSRDEAALRALASTHLILGVQQGAFVSLLDPPGCCREAAAACLNIGLWPVLVGAEGERDTMLASPIILYDYPQVAPESPGDFFDGTEIDEMLTLRVLTLTDEEKQAMAAVDERAGALLARTEALAREQMLGLHGTVRNLRPLP